MILEDSDTSKARIRITDFNIVDAKCSHIGYKYCSICEVPAPVVKVRVRGLCQLSLFDRSFKMTLTDLY